MYFVPNLEITEFILLSNKNHNKPCKSDVIYGERKNAQIDDFSYILVIILSMHHRNHIVYKVIQSAVIEIFLILNT